MTKNGRRNHRKKPCTTADAAVNAEGVGKDTHGKEKGGKDVRVPAVPVAAAKSPHSTSDDSIRGWFSGLSWQDQASVTSIEDTAFVATLFDLASSSSGPHHSSGSSGT